MFKFLRRYSKWILAIGGTLLLIVFLIPQAIQGLSQRAAQSTATQATVGPKNRKVPAADLQTVHQELQFMQQRGMVAPGMERLDRNPWHWYLLVREAEEAGLVGAGIGSISPEDLRGSGFRPEIVQGVVSKVAGVGLLLNMYQSSAQFSDHRLRQTARRLFHRVRIQPLVIEAKPEGAGIQPTDEALAEQMAKYADVEPGDPESTFGYRLPDRVNLEWITIPADVIRAAVESSDRLSGTELRKHWMRNPNNRVDFPPVPDEPPAQVPQVVREDLLQSLIDEKRQEIARFATNQLRARTHGLRRVDDGSLDLPEDWPQRRLAFEALAGLITEREGMARPDTHRVDDRWLDAEALDELEGIGLAGTDAFPPGRKRLADLIAVAREFAGSTTIQIQSGVAGPPLDDTEGNVYIFRITDHDAARAPDSIDEVRQQLVDDLARIRNFERLREQLETIRQQAIDEGLLALALEHDTTVLREKEVSLYDASALFRHTAFRQPLEPEPSTIPGIGASKDTIEQIVSHAMSIEGDLADLDVAERTLVIPVEDKLAVLVVRLLDQTPVSETDYRARVASNHLQQILRNEELGGFESVMDAFSYKALAARHNFKSFTEDGAETGPDGETEGQPDVGAEGEVKTSAQANAGS